MGTAMVAGVRQKPKFSAAMQTDTYKKLISNTLRDPKRAERFVAAITSAVAVNPALQECDAGTILAGALLGESLKLSPSPQLGQFYLVPFDCKVKDENGKVIYKRDEKGNVLKDKKGRWIAETEKKASFVLGYKGYLQLAIRSGYYSDIDAVVIKEGEYLGKDRMSGKPKFEFIEDEDKWEALPVAGYMAYFEYLNGFKKVIYWSKDKMLRHADKYSPAFSAADYDSFVKGEIPKDELWKYSSFWYGDFDGMALKTMIRQLVSKWGVMSTEMQMAIEKDDVLTSFHGNEIVTDSVDVADMTAGDSLPPVMGANSFAEIAEPEYTEVAGEVDLSSL